MIIYKQLIAICLMFSIAFAITACSDDELEPERTPIPYLKIMEAPNEWQNAVFDIDCNEQTITVTCQTNISNLRIDCERFPWIKIGDMDVKKDPENETFQYQTYTFRIGANESTTAREGLIVIYGYEGEVVEVHQAAPVSP